MKPPVTMVCSIPVSAAWNAFCRCCSLPAMMYSTAAEFMPATASRVITSSSSKPTTSAAPRCLRWPSVLKCAFVTTVSSGSISQRVADLNGFRDQQVPVTLHTREAVIGAERGLIGLGVVRHAGQIARRAVQHQAVSILVYTIVAKARLGRVGAHQKPDPHRYDLGGRRNAGQQVGQRRARIEVFGRSPARGADARGQIDPVLHLQVLDPGHELVVLKAWQCRCWCSTSSGAVQGLAPQRRHTGLARALIDVVQV